MRALSKSLFILLIASLLLLPSLAQETGSGEPIIEPNFGDDIKTLNPIIANDGPSDDVIERIFPKFINLNPETLQYEPNAIRALVDDWEISEDGTVYTFTLGQDWTWSDGVPVTAADVVWFWDAASSGETSTPRQTLVDGVQSMVALDDYTLEVTFSEASCTSLDLLDPIYAVPAHVYDEVYGDDYATMDDNDYNMNPTVTSGDFVFANFRPGEQVTTLANPIYPDAQFGSVIPAGWVYKTVTDQVVQMEQFYAGELSWVDSIPQASREEFRERAAVGEFQMFEAPATTMRFLSFNMADPSNPQDGLDDDGNPIDQGFHPIFGDVRVRQALAYAMDFDAVNQGAFFGEEVQGASNVLPTSWAYDESLQPFPYDPAMADQLLTEAGWTDNDGDGIRECHGCLHAEEGTPLAFRLETNSGNTSQEALYTILQDQWGEMGFDVDFQTLDFNVLIDNFTGQSYDAIGIFWGYGVPDDPDGTRNVFTPAADVVGSGYNTQSYNNPRVTELLDEARTLPGCDPDARAELYAEVWQILRNELPWIWISTGLVPGGAQANIENWNPVAGYTRWNIDGWTISQQ